MPAFDVVGDSYERYKDEVRGAIREDVTRINLQNHLPESPGTAIDVGGGRGKDASWLASMGWDVTMVDESSSQLDHAKKLFKELDQNVSTFQGTAETAVQEFRGKSFDLVLSHGVLMYCVERPQQHVDALALLVAPNGIVSVLTKGFKGAMRRFDDKNCQEAKDLKRTHRVINNLGELTLALTPNELNGMLRKTKLKVRDWYGVRIASENDHRLLTDLGEGEYGQIFANEIILSSNPVKRPFGQMLHSIGEA